VNSTTGVHAALLDRIDPGTGALHLEQRGAFWSAIRLARQQGRTGRGVEVAVGDVGFEPVARFTPDDAGRRATHGTLVTALIRGVAPQASLREILLGTDEVAYRTAFEALATRPPDIVNISAGARRTILQAWEVHGNRFPARHLGLQAPEDARSPGSTCTYCPPVEELVDAGTLVTTAVGNGFPLAEDEGEFLVAYWCPAWSPRTMSCGFAGDRPDAAVVQPKAPLGFQMGMESDWLLQQPDGVYGSSYAAPLVAGALALLDDRQVVGPMFTGRIRSGFDMLRFAAEGDRLAAPETRRKLEASLAKLPDEHRHDGTVTEACYACALLIPGLRSDLGMLLVLEGAAGSAVTVLEQAERLVPEHPDQAANLGAAYRALAFRSDPPSRELLGRSREAYRRAYERRPSERFANLLRGVEAALAAE